MLTGREVSPFGIAGIAEEAGPAPANDGGGICCVGGPTLCFRACAANIRSASSPCLSPLPSFLYAYCTETCLFMRYWPFILAMAASDDSKSAKETNPYPLDRLLSSRAIYYRLALMDRVSGGGICVSNLGKVDQIAKTAEGVVENLLGNHGIQVSDKELRANFHGFLLVR